MRVRGNTVVAHGAQRHLLERMVLAPLQAAPGRAYLVDIAGDQQRQASRPQIAVRQAGQRILLSALRPSRAGGTQFGTADYTLLVLLYPSVGVTSVPRIAFPGRREGRILAPATAIATFLGCNVANKYRLRIQAGCKLAEIAESVHGLVIIQCEVMDCLAHERGVPVSCGARLPTAVGWIVANAAWRTSARRSWST